MSENKLGWDLFYSCFTEGDEVVAIDVDDQFFWGKMVNPTFEGCELHANGRTRKLLWDDVRFMAHDGFPVRKILGADGSATIEKLDTTDTQAAVRSALSTEFPERPRHQVRFGDPFDVVEPVHMELYNPGNSGPSFWRHFWNETTRLWHSPAHVIAHQQTEEVIVMKANDGARAQLWDMTTVYVFE